MTPTQKTILAAALLALLSKSPLCAHGGDWEGLYASIQSGATLGSGSAMTKLKQDGYTFAYPDNKNFDGEGAKALSSMGIPLGIGGGYNFQFGDWVAGIYAEYSLSPADMQVKYSKDYASFTNQGYKVRESVKADNLIRISPKIGYAFGKWLFSGNAGLAYSNMRAETNIGEYNYLNSSASKALSGGAFGLISGVSAEYMIVPHWALIADYSYANFSLRGETGASNTFNSNFSVAGDLVLQNAKLGLNYYY